MKFLLDNGHLQTAVSISSPTPRSCTRYHSYEPVTVTRILSVGSQHGQCLPPSNHPHVYNFETFILQVKQLTCLFVQQSCEQAAIASKDVTVQNYVHNDGNLQGGKWCIAPCILNFGASTMSAIRLTLQPLCHRDRGQFPSLYPLHRTPSQPHNRCKRGKKHNKTRNVCIM